MSKERVLEKNNKELYFHENKKFGKRYDLGDFRKSVVDLLSQFKMGLNINQISSQLEINRNTVSKYLKMLEAAGIVKSRKSGVSRNWFRVSEKKRVPGPNIIVVKNLTGVTIEIQDANTIYQEAIGVIPENLVGHSIWNFYPFNHIKTDLEPILLQAFQQVNANNLIVSNQVECEINNSIINFLFNIHFNPKQSGYYSIEFYNKTLEAELEHNLLNPTNFDKLMNLLTNSYISVQTEGFKIIKANQKVLEQFNNNQPLKGTTYCYSLFFKRVKVCDQCPAIEAMKTGKPGKVVIPNIIPEKGEFNYTTYPIESKSGDKGFILKIDEEKR